MTDFSHIQLPCEINFVFDEWDDDTHTPKPNRLKNFSYTGDDTNTTWVSTMDTIGWFDGVKANPRKLQDVIDHPEENFYYHVWFRRNISCEIFNKKVLPVDDEIIEMVQKYKNFFLIIMNEQESEPLKSFIELNDIVALNNLSPEKIWFISNNERLQEYKYKLNSKVNVHTCRAIIKSVGRNEISTEDYWPEEKSHFFLCHNRTVRMHRYALLVLLKSSNLLDYDTDWSLVNGWQFKKYSMPHLKHVNNFFIDLLTFDDIIKYQNEINFFISLDVKKSSYETDYTNFDSRTAQVVFSEPKSYQNSYFNIASETNFLTEDIHITEKTFKPFFYFQFPIICGVYNHIKYVKNAYPGLDFFDDVINHDYDNIQNNRDRLFAIVELVKEINSNKQFYKNFYKNNKERFLSNHMYIKNYVNTYDYNFFKQLSTTP